MTCRERVAGPCVPTEYVPTVRPRPRIPRHRPDRIGIVCAVCAVSYEPPIGTPISLCFSKTRVLTSRDSYSYMAHAAKLASMHSLANDVSTPSMRCQFRLLRCHDPLSM